MIKESDVVYLIENDFNLVKVGITTNFNQRLTSIQMSGGFFAKRTFCLPCNEKEAVEREMHKKFKKDHVIGEWFKTSFNDLKKALQNDIWIKNICEKAIEKRLKNIDYNNFKKNEKWKRMDRPRLYTQRGIYYIETTKNGQAERRSLKTRDFDEAKKIYKDFICKINDDEESSIFLNEAISIFLDTKKDKISKRTFKQYKYELLTLRKVCQNILTNTFLKTDIERLNQYYLDKGFSEVSIKTKNRIIRVFFNFLKNEGYLLKTPYQKAA